jgi:hypothetical protein
MMNVIFEIEAFRNADGNWEIVGVECDPTSEAADDTLEASEIDVGSWEFRFTVASDFDGGEAVFSKLERYGLSSETVSEACSEALRNPSVS